MPLKSNLGTSNAGEKSVPGDASDAECQRSGSDGEQWGGTRSQAGPWEGMHLESGERLIWRLAHVESLGRMAAG